MCFRHSAILSKSVVFRGLSLTAYHQFISGNVYSPGYFNGKEKIWRLLGVRVSSRVFGDQSSVLVHTVVLNECSRRWEDEDKMRRQDTEEKVDRIIRIFDERRTIVPGPTTRCCKHPRVKECRATSTWSMIWFSWWIKLCIFNISVLDNFVTVS